MGSSLAAEKRRMKLKIVLYYPALSIPDDAHQGSMLGEVELREGISFKVMNDKLSW